MAAVDGQEQICLPTALSCVSELIESKPDAFITGDETTHTAALNATKYAFDLSLEREKRARPSIAQLMRSIETSARPETRSQRKRKRSPSPLPPRTDEAIWPPTPLESLHLEGMDGDQVWAQLELRASTLCEILKAVVEERVEEEEQGGGDDSIEIEDEESLESLDDEEELDHDFDGHDGSEEEEQDSYDVEEEDGFEEEVTDLRDPPDEDSEDEDRLDLDRPTRPTLRKSKGGDRVASGKHQGGHPILDDGFFSLADFNAETEEAEAKDVSKGRLGQDEDDDDDDDIAEDDVDLFAAVDDVGRDTFEEDDLETGGELYYRDFFLPPRKLLSTGRSNPTELSPDKKNKQSKVRFHDEVRVKKIKSHGKGNSVASMKRGMSWAEDDGDDDDEEGGGEEEEEEEEDDGFDFGGELDEEVDGDDDLTEDEYVSLGGGGESRDTIERLKDDLFADDEDEDSPRDLSKYEAHQAEIAAQIVELEAKSVGPKEWTLMGEATSRSRPVNSLLEEDLDFERAMKVVPVLTEERVIGIEDIVKKRILDSHFDDVVRKRPVDDKPFLPSRYFELNDQKSVQSLAQIYENDYSAATNGKAGVDDRDGKLMKEHEELEKMWDSICHKLDALSNAHFTPKQPKATVSTVSNLLTTTMESALPTTKSVTTMLAPEEIFAAPSETRAREELTPTEKRAHRNKQRKARRKAKDYLATSVDKFARTHKAKGSAVNIKKEKERALKSIVKTGKGVTVVGKKSAEIKRRGQEKAGAIVPMDSKKFKL